MFRYHYVLYYVNMTSVAIVKGTNPSKMVQQALHMTGAFELIKPEDKVLIKPNYVVAKDPSTGVSTDSRVIESLIEFTKSIDVRDIVVGEGGAVDTDRAFDVVGIRDVTVRHGVELVNLNKDQRVKLKVTNSLALPEIEVAQTALDSTCIINVPTLKVHHLALVTLCMKNLMGLILPKSIMHSQINEKIVDLASLFIDRVRFNVIDGLIGAEVDETSGNPVRMDLIIAGEDMVAVDTVGSAVMGLDPSQVKYLRLAEEAGLGVTNLKNINVLGEDIETVRQKFKLPSRFRRALASFRALR